MHIAAALLVCRAQLIV